MVKVLIVDDSALVRSILKSGIERFGDVTVIGTASDPYEARDLISREVPDVITLDIEMPKMNGIEFLRHLMTQLPIPVIMVSSFSEQGKQITMDALSYGAIDFVTKPQASNSGALTEMIYDLHKKIIMASRVKRSSLVVQGVVDKAELRQYAKLFLGCHRIFRLFLWFSICPWDSRVYLRND